MRRVSALGLAVCVASSLNAQSGGNPLRPLTKCVVTVTYAGKPDLNLPDSDRVRTIVELRSRTLGIRVLTVAEAARDPESIPLFDANITAIALSNRGGVRTGLAYNLDLSLIEWTSVVRTHSAAPAILWTEGNLQSTGTDDIREVFERDLNNQLDKFANALLRANPPQRP